MDNLNYIKNELSLREPLKHGLDILAKAADTTILDKTQYPEDLATYQKEWTQGIAAQFPSYQKNEWDFPCLAMSIATGVGKTRLMGAMIAYLYLEKGVRNFFVLAPNLTIYNKLIEDFGNPSYHKYVFQGIAAFVNNRPIVVTGDNYAQTAGLFHKHEVRINVFNISKFNSDNKATKEGGQAKAPRMKRISEYLGQSYWDYLRNLPDLVLLMDEAHRYRGTSSAKAINELAPVLGVELTATPYYTEKHLLFENIAYEYSLSNALNDGFVKNIYIGTRANFNPKGLTPEAIDQASLEAAHTRHQDTKLELERYALENNKAKVKPFILVVCKDTTHAAETLDFLTSKRFFDGEYEGKVLQIDSTTRTDDEIEKQFLTLENADNDIEIVIHVNMLKEGWDVTNLYTITVLRKADAKVLVEQTIGRGLRLPYEGARTGVEKVDALTIIEHYNFDAVIKEAADAKSILNRSKFIEVTVENAEKDKAEIITSEANFLAEKRAEQIEIRKIENETVREAKLLQSDAQVAVYTLLQTANRMTEVKNMIDLQLPEVQEKIIRQYEKKLSEGQGNIFKTELIAEAKAVYQQVVAAFRAQVIEIPRISLLPQLSEPHFADFDLDTNAFHYKKLEEYLQIYDLQGFRKEVLTISQNHDGTFKAKEYIMTLLLDFPEIQYEICSEMIAKFATEAIESISKEGDNLKSINSIVKSFGRVIAKNIYEQMMEHYSLVEGDYLPPDVRPFTAIEPHHNTNFVNYGIKHHRENINPTSNIPKYLFEGFKKSAHERYRFDSKVEKDFATLLEEDPSVLKWLRPAKTQFNIYYNNQKNHYIPDFVIETATQIYLIETKGADKIKSEEVRQKTKAALLYCENASVFTAKNGGKPWSYLLIPHDEVRANSSFEYLITRFMVI